MSGMGANEVQVGGSHYMKQAVCPHCSKELQHWDVAWAFGFDSFQYILTKWIFRWRSKGGIDDLYKAQHAISKYIEVVERDIHTTPMSHEDMVRQAGGQPAGLDASGHPGPGYTNQG